MQLKELFNQKKVVLSFEIFPPKKDGSIDTIYSTLDELSDLKPDFISVTYGAGGSENRNSTVEIASIVKSKYNIEPVAHLVCVNSSKDDIDNVLAQLKKNNIKNIMALRGDKTSDFNGHGDFKFASDLVKHIKQDSFFNISVACYPEGHGEAISLDADIENLKYKVDCGATNLITQMFFNNESYYDFHNKITKKGINVPIQAGIMPVLNTNQITRMVAMCGASLPNKFVKIINKYENDPVSLFDAGIAYATDQIIDLITNGIDGIHLYIMNKPVVAQKISANIKNIINSANN